MQRIDPKSTATKDFHQYMLGSIAPRPIAFVSTINDDGTDNLAPYSFFNAFSSNPPIVVFSSNRRVSDNTTKDTLHNIQKNMECVINVVNYEIVRQMAVTSIQFDTGISEFEKAGLTPLDSELIRSKRVAESPVQMECKVNDIVTLGDHGGAGHLIICEIVLMHIDDNVLDGNRIDPHKLDLMGRMGRAYYVRASGDAIHTIVQPVTKISLGYDKLPESVKNSQVLSANDIGIFAGMLEFPSKEEIESVRTKNIITALLTEPNPIASLHKLASELNSKNEFEAAFKVVLFADTLK